MIFYLLLVATPTNQKVEFAQAQVSQGNDSILLCGVQSKIMLQD